MRSGHLRQTNGVGRHLSRDGLTLGRAADHGGRQYDIGDVARARRSARTGRNPKLWCADMTVPGPWFTLYGDGTIIYYSAVRGWISGHANHSAVRQLLDTARRLQLLERPVAVDGPPGTDEVPQYILINHIEDTFHDSDASHGGYTQLHSFLDAITSLEQSTPSGPWTAPAWIGFGPPGDCLTVVAAPATPTDLSAHPVMPDLNSGDPTTAMYGSRCKH